MKHSENEKNIKGAGAHMKILPADENSQGEKVEHVWIHIAYNIFNKWYPTQAEKEMFDIYFQIKGKINENS